MLTGEVLVVAALADGVLPAGEVALVDSVVFVSGLTRPGLFKLAMTSLVKS